MHNILNITRESFRKYGNVIELGPDSSGGWEIVVREKRAGWRIACLEFSRKSSDVLERHSESKESFEPLHGISLLIAGVGEGSEDWEVFLLDKPVCLNEGVWHQIIALSESAAVKITENLEVDCEYRKLFREICPVVL